MKSNYKMREEVKTYLEYDFELTEDAYIFYYRCMNAGMHYADADRYAILNTLFNYDIGVENAEALNEWMYLHDADIYDLSASSEEDKAMVELASTECGLNLDFSNWIKEDFKSYKFFN